MRVSTPLLVAGGLCVLLATAAAGYLFGQGTGALQTSVTAPLASPAPPADTAGVGKPCGVPLGAKGTPLVLTDSGPAHDQALRIALFVKAGNADATEAIKAGTVDAAVAGKAIVTLLVNPRDCGQDGCAGYVSWARGGGDWFAHPFWLARADHLYTYPDGEHPLISTAAAMDDQTMVLRFQDAEGGGYTDCDPRGPTAVHQAAVEPQPIQPRTLSTPPSAVPAPTPQVVVAPATPLFKCSGPEVEATLASIYEKKVTADVARTATQTTDVTVAAEPGVSEFALKLAEVRTTGRDPNTGAVSCIGKLSYSYAIRVNEAFAADSKRLVYKKDGRPAFPGKVFITNFGNGMQYRDQHSEQGEILVDPEGVTTDANGFLTGRSKHLRAVRTEELTASYMEQPMDDGGFYLTVTTEADKRRQTSQD